VPGAHDMYIHPKRMETELVTYKRWQSSCLPGDRSACLACFVNPPGLSLVCFSSRAPDYCLNVAKQHNTGVYIPSKVQAALIDHTNNTRFAEFLQQRYMHGVRGNNKNLLFTVAKSTTCMIPIYIHVRRHAYHPWYVYVQERGAVYS
jgi:hypothetical protein